MKRIRIIGTPGSGKTYLAKLISKKLKIPVYDLDDVYWQKKYTKRRDPKKIGKLIKKIIKKRKWIIEGMQWGIESEWIVKRSDVTVWVDPGLIKIIFRLIMRHVKRKEKTLIGTLQLLKAATKYKLNIFSGHKKAHKDYLKKYNNKFIIIKGNKDLQEFLEKTK